MIRKTLALRRMLGSARLSPSALARSQARRLEALVRYAATQVPFYRQLYSDARVDARAFCAGVDFERLPIIDKAQLRAAGVRARSPAVGQPLVAIRTSGSSGEPFEFLINRAYDQWRKAQYLRPYLQAGRRLRDKVLRLTASPRTSRSWLNRIGLMREVQLPSAMDSALVADVWQREAPQILQGYPSSLRALAHYGLERGRPLHPQPRLVFTDSEMLLPDTRALLEQQFQARVLDIFGTYETDNIGFQCMQRDGYHVATDCVVLEIVRDGKPVAAGVEGEIVVTVLANYATPFIRYNLHDVGRLLPRPCPCGLPFPLLTGLQGRADDLIRLEAGRERTAMDVLGGLDGFAQAVRQYQLRQIALDRFELLIVPSSQYTEADGERLCAAVSRHLGHAQLTLRLMPKIPPLRSGKWRAFVQELPELQRA